MLAECFFGAGVTPDAITNIENYIDAPQVLDNGRIPLLGPVKTRLMDSSSRRDGKINVSLKFDVPPDTGRISMNTFLFGNQTTSGKELYLSALDEFSFYSPFLVYVDRPYEAQDYTLTPGGIYVQALVLPCFDWRLQVLTKTANYSVTTVDHYLKGDTTSGNITFTLPPLSAVNEAVVYSFELSAGGNDLVLAKAAGDGGGTLLTLSVLGSRVDIAKVNGAWKTVKTGFVL